jgi:hypothetical protein
MKPDQEASATPAIRIPMTPDKECKGSIRYAAAADDAAVASVYLSRSAFKSMPKSIVVTIEPK